MNFSHFLGVLSFVAVGAATAQDLKPPVAPAPLEFLRKPDAITAKDRQKLTDEFERLARASGVRLPSPASMKAALDGSQRQDWASSDEALAQFAQRAQMLYGLYVQLDFPLTGNVVGVGRVVRSDGTRVGEQVRIERAREKKSYVQVSTETIIAVLEKLQLQNLPSSVPLVAAAPVKVPPEAPAVVPPRVDPPAVLPPVMLEKRGTSGQRLVAYGVGGAGLVAAGVGAGFLIAASIDKSALKVDANGNVGVPPTAEAAARARNANVSATVGLSAVSIGCAAVIVAAVVYATSPSDAPRPTASVGFSMLPGGAIVGLTLEVP